MVHDLDYNRAMVFYVILFQRFIGISKDSAKEASVILLSDSKERRSFQIFGMGLQCRHVHELLLEIVQRHLFEDVDVF